MGYYFDINGTINCSNNRAYMILKYLFKESRYPFNEGVEDFDFDDNSNSIEICCNIKNYNEYIERVCFFIHELDKEAQGTIELIGEDSNDRFEVSLCEKGIKLGVAEVIWKHQKGYYENKDTSKELNKILKDKNLNKNLIVCSLEEKK